MGDDDELRARIEAQVASRRAAAPPPKRDRFGRNGQDGDPGADAAAPRSLEPARPWLTGEAISIDPDEPDDGVEDGDQSGNSRNLGPARPWLSRPAALPGAAGPPPPHDPASGTQLQPVRPWLRRAVKAEPDQPDEPEPAAAGPAIESVDDSTSPPQPARVLQEHWARERAALIAERAALMAEREALLAHRTALSGLRESTVAADPEIEPAARKRGRLGRRRPAAVHSDGATAEAARHAAAPGQPGAPQSGPVSPFESFRTPEVVSAPAVERPADDPDLAGGDSRLGADEQHDAPEHIDVDAAVEGDEGARTGWSRRTLGWLLAPAEQPQHQEPSTEETAPGDEDDRVRAPEQHGLPPWRLLPDVEPAAPARANRPEPEPVAEQPVPVPLPVPEPQPLSEPKPEPAAAAGAAEHPPVGPGTDLPRRLAAANAAAMARALASEAYDFPEDDDDDGDVPQQRRAAAFVRPSGPRPAGIARERDETAATSSPLVTGTAFAQRNVPPADIDADGPTPVVAKRHRVTVRGAARLLVVVVIAAVIATLLRTYVIAPYYIPSASMEPTLHGCTGCNNDHVLVDKLSYKMHDIHRGDVVVFHRPKAWQVTEQVLIKRVIGLPGDKLSARNGIVYVDGLALEEPYLDKACQSGTTNLPTKPVTVPDGEAYVMGDNRCDSSDSRRFGAIPDSAVIGRAFLIVWPLGRLHWL